MNYHHKSDIDEDQTIDASKLNDSLVLCVNRIRAAFSNLCKTHDETFCQILDEIFTSFLATHKSIRLLLKESYKDQDYAPDAKSLTREQIEKVFVLTLILDDPSKWIPIYFKDDWRRLYKFLYLTEAEERSKLLRYASWQDELSQMLEKMRANSFVSDQEKELIEHKFKNPGNSKPAHLAGVEIPMFPMPRDVINKLSDPHKKSALLRWHKEYEYLCGYSHVGLDKFSLSSVRKTKLTDKDKKEFFEIELLFSTFYVSCIAGASICTEAWRYISRFDPDLSKSADFLKAIFDYWAILSSSSLKGKLFWDIHASHVFPPLVGNSD